MRWGLLAALLLATGFAAAASADSSPLAKADAAMAQARKDDMPLLAPEAWDKATEAYAHAKEAVDRNRAQAQIDKYVGEVTNAINGAADVVKVGHTTFDATLTSRSNALSAGADQLATRIFTKAEEQFRKAAITLEDGRTEKAQSQAVEAVQSYRAAELEAIKGAILRDASHLLAQAEQENVEKYAPQTLAQSRASLAEAEKAIVEDRYDTDRARLLAKQAKEQASHALHLAAQIKGVNGGDRTFEEVLLRSEAPVVDIANALGVTPDLTNGVASTAAATLAAVKEIPARPRAAEARPRRARRAHRHARDDARRRFEGDGRAEHAARRTTGTARPARAGRKTVRAERGRSAAHRQFGRVAAGRPQLRQRRRDDQIGPGRTARKSRTRDRHLQRLGDHGRRPHRFVRGRRIESGVVAAARRRGARVPARQHDARPVPDFGDGIRRNAADLEQRNGRRPRAQSSNRSGDVCAVVTETRIGAQRAGLLLATILAHGCVPPDPAATATSALPPRHVVAAPRPVEAAQLVAATQAVGATQSPDDADRRCRLATRLTENVESCLASRDADHDAVDDSADECPDTTPGVTVDATGCALPVSDR